MSIIIQTVYPCVECETEIAPSKGFCPRCGAKQPDLTEATVYNVFTRWPCDSESFHPKFGGEPILTPEDLDDAVAVYCQENDEYYLASYRSTDFDSEGRLCVRSWRPVIKGVVGEDQGRVVITLNYLE